PSFGAGSLPRGRLGERDHALKGRSKHQRVQQGTAFLERQRHRVALIEPQQIEHVVHDPFAAPGNFAIENQIVRGKVQDRVGDGRQVLRQAVSREQLYFGSLFKGEQANAVEFLLKRPLGSIEPFLRQCRRHRFEPFWKGGHWSSLETYVGLESDV